jgi:signal transduction histidine kinase
MQLAAQVKEIPVEVTVRGEDSERYSHLSRVLYDTTREAITNSLKYASATRIEIVVRFQEKSVELVIGDDGRGCDAIRENNGIRGIRERVEQAGGTVRFSSAVGEGFLMRVNIPV